MTIVPVYNMTIIPESDSYIQTDHFVKMAGKNPEEGERIIFLFLKKDEVKQTLTEDSFYEIGVTGVIREVNENGYVVIHSTGRVKVDEVHFTSAGTIQLTITKRPDIPDLDKDYEKEHLP